jgi:predicted porin
VAAFAVVAVINGAALHPAWADGLGGSCCADLEARVAELEATTARQGNRRVSLTLSGQVTRQLMYWNDGEQHDVYSVDQGLNTSRFRFTGSAKINPEIQAGFVFEMDLRIGARSNQVSQIDDDGVSGSGGILGSAPFGDGVGAAGDSVIAIRQANWYLESKSVGRLTVGRLNAASYNIATIDLSNAGAVITSEPGEYQGSFLMRNGLGRLSATAPAAGSTVAGVGATWNTMCGGPNGAGPYSGDCAEFGTDRRDAVRYDTPTFWGFTASGTYGEGHYYDAALRYAGEFGAFRVAAGAGYRWYQDREPDVPFPAVAPIDRLADTDRRHWLGSASIMHMPTGLFASGAYTNFQWGGSNANEVFGGVAGSDDHRPNIPLWWFDAGIQKNWTGWGNTTFYGEWGRYDDGTTGLLANVAYPGLGPNANTGFAASAVVLDSSVQWWGAGVVQTIDAAAMDVFLAYRQYQADATISGGPASQIPGGLNDIWFIQAGARIQF